MCFLVLEVQDRDDHEVVSIGPFLSGHHTQAVIDACQWSHADKVWVSDAPVGGHVSIDMAVRRLLFFDIRHKWDDLEMGRYVLGLISHSYGLTEAA